MDLLGGLNPTVQQAGQNQALTAQQQKQAQDLATMLQKEGQNQANKQFTSPWQVAGQWAQALAGKGKQAQLNQGYQTLEGLNVPGQPAPAPGTAAPGTPGIPSGATPVTPSALPWSGSGADAGMYVDPSMVLTG